MENQDLEESEAVYGYYVEQEDLETVKKWFEEIRDKRAEEADRLEAELEEAEADLEEFETDLEETRQWKPKKHLDTANGQIVEDAVDVERYRRMLRDKRDYTLRRLRDLVKQDREDLEWIRKLERSERLETEREEQKATEEYRPTTKSQQRAANWKARKGNPKQT